MSCPDLLAGHGISLRRYLPISNPRRASDYAGSEFPSINPANVPPFCIHGPTANGFFCRLDDPKLIRLPQLAVDLIECDHLSMHQSKKHEAFIEAFAVRHRSSGSSAWPVQFGACA